MNSTGMLMPVTAPYSASASELSYPHAPISSAGRKVATTEFRRDVEVRMAVIGMAEAKRGFICFLGFTNFPPCVRYHPTDTIKENMYEISTATVARYAPSVGVAAVNTSIVPSITMTLSSASSMSE